MYSFVQLYIIVGVFSYLTHSAYAIKCYACESSNNQNCGENFDDENIPTVDCQEEPLPRYLAVYEPKLKSTGCKKLILENMDGTRKIERFCYFGSLNDTKQGCRREPTFVGITIQCDVCSDDLCNNSFKIVPKVMAILLSIFTIYYYLFSI